MDLGFFSDIQGTPSYAEPLQIRSDTFARLKLGHFSSVVAIVSRAFCTLPPGPQTLVVLICTRARGFLGMRNAGKAREDLLKVQQLAQSHNRALAAIVKESHVGPLHGFSVAGANSVADATEKSRFGRIT